MRNLLLCLLILAAPVFAQSVNFEAVRVRPQIKGGEQGLELEFRATVEGLKGKTCEFNVVFFDNQGQTLKDKDQKYYSASGDVSAAVTFKAEPEHVKGFETVRLGI